MQQGENGKLARNLKNRHIQLIALGGAIGTGLFYGSAETIKFVGPGVMLSYAIGGLIIYLIMRMLGEMSTQEPVAGAFSYFSNRYWNEFTGFLSGWNYWLLYILVSMAELTAVGIFVNFWWPDFPHWASALIVLVSITLLNLSSVKFYGESEFWMCIIKIVAVISMIVFGIVLVFFGIGHYQATGLKHWTMHGGFLPNGFTGLLLSLAPVMFSFGGLELISITAGEAQEPTKSIPRAINQVIWRILVFYIGALGILVALYPWDRIGDAGSPFVMIFSHIGIPSAAHILNVVVLCATISVYNGGLYSNGRMLYNLACQGDAPRVFTRLGKRRIPWVAVLFSSACTGLIIPLNILLPEGAFMRVMALVTAAMVITWVVIVIVHIRFRRAHDRAELHFPAPFFPWINYLCIAFLLLILGIMWHIESMRMAVYVLPIWLGIVWLGYKISHNGRRARVISRQGEG